MSLLQNLNMLERSLPSDDQLNKLKADISTIPDRQIERFFLHDLQNLLTTIQTALTINTLKPLPTLTEPDSISPMEQMLRAAVALNSNGRAQFLTKYLSLSEPTLEVFSLLQKSTQFLKNPTREVYKKFRDTAINISDIKKILLNQSRFPAETLSPANDDFYLTGPIGVALMNLIFNARKYGQQEFSVESDCNAQIWVRNISTTPLPDKPFALGSSGRGSSGFGLYLAKTYTRMEGGEINYQQQELEANRFSILFSLPAISPERNKFYNTA